MPQTVFFLLFLASILSKSQELFIKHCHLSKAGASKPIFSRMEDDMRPLTEAMAIAQPSKRVKRTEILMDVTVLVEKKILMASTDINESNVVSKGYKDTIAKTTAQLLKDEKELASWTQLLADLELEESKPGTGSQDASRQEAMKNIIADKGSVSQEP